MNRIKLRKLLKEFLIEDIGEMDITSQLIFPLQERSKGQYLVKKEGILSGIEIIKEAYHLLDPTIEVILHKQDGEFINKGDLIATVHGPVAYLLSGERVILNLIQHMCGISTLTNKAVQTLNSDHTRICDTRKTLPGLRMFEKYAVRCGGGYNHRFGLYDGVMLKDNHITYAGSIKAAVLKVRSQVGHMVKIEVETESKEQVIEAIEAGADIIMFDNRSPEEVSQFVKLVPNGIVTEISGGVTLETIGLYSNTNVDYISLGMLTHSVQALDISFNLEGGVK